MRGRILSATAFGAFVVCFHSFASTIPDDAIPCAFQLVAGKGGAIRLRYSMTPGTVRTVKGAKVSRRLLRSGQEKISTLIQDGPVSGDTLGGQIFGLLDVSLEEPKQILLIATEDPRQVQVFDAPLVRLGAPEGTVLWNQRSHLQGIFPQELDVAQQAFAEVLPAPYGFERVIRTQTLSVEVEDLDDFRGRARPHHWGESESTYVRLASPSSLFTHTVRPLLRTPAEAQLVDSLRGNLGPFSASAPEMASTAERLLAQLGRPRELAPVHSVEAEAALRGWVKALSGEDLESTDIDVQLWRAVNLKAGWVEYVVEVFDARSTGTDSRGVTVGFHFSGRYTIPDLVDGIDLGTSQALGNGLARMAAAATARSEALEAAFRLQP